MRNGFEVAPAPGLSTSIPTTLRELDLQGANWNSHLVIVHQSGLGEVLPADPVALAYNSIPSQSSEIITEAQRQVESAQPSTHNRHRGKAFMAIASAAAVAASLFGGNATAASPDSVKPVPVAASGESNPQSAGGEAIQQLSPLDQSDYFAGTKVLRPTSANFANIDKSGVDWNHTNPRMVNSERYPNQIPGKVIHPVYMVPYEGPANFPGPRPYTCTTPDLQRDTASVDTHGSINNTFKSWSDFFLSPPGSMDPNSTVNANDARGKGKMPRFDLYNGGIDSTFIKVSASDGFPFNFSCGQIYWGSANGMGDGVKYILNKYGLNKPDEYYWVILEAGNNSSCSADYTTAGVNWAVFYPNSFPECGDYRQAMISLSNFIGNLGQGPPDRFANPNDIRSKTSNGVQSVFSVPANQLVIDKSYQDSLLANPVFAVAPEYTPPPAEKTVGVRVVRSGSTATVKASALAVTGAGISCSNIKKDCSESWTVNESQAVNEKLRATSKNGYVPKWLKCSGKIVKNVCNLVVSKANETADVTKIASVTAVKPPVKKPA